MSDRTAVARVGDVALWVVQAAVAAYFVYSGVMLFGDGLVGKFEEIGFGQWLRYLTGVLEIAGAIGLVIPPLCGLAALGLAGVMVGAVATELFLVENGGPVLPAILLAITLAIAWLRRDTILALLPGRR
ncbi:DoxX family protein [Actinokineospora soli]|uniref:DoxX family protein n=1 Tax=Actinokineospora soli TaxID=1048753 RepID=A0ABW2TU79_9PSEU